MAVVFRTDEATDDSQFARFQDIYASVYLRMDITSDVPEAFHASIDQTWVGPMLFAENTVGRHTVNRTRQHIAQGSDDLVIIPLISEGTCAVFQDGREAVIGAGEFALIDVDRPTRRRSALPCSRWWRCPGRC